MTIAQVSGFLEALYQSQLLQSPQLKELDELGCRFSDERELARVLLQRNWLTPYQINRLMQGKAEELRIGPYVLLEKLGEGGMGQVFKARHAQTGEVVALKVLRPKLLNNEIAVARFQREVHVIEQLGHPNIVRALDAGVDDGQHYFAMEFIQGTDLSRMVKEKGPLNVRQACEYIRQAALALQHGFEKGLVHRDIKPANLLVMTPPDSFVATLDRFDRQQLEKWGMVKVLDMGLARVISQDDEAATTLTQINVIMGTPDFISPEQAINSHDCDIRSDLYSLGCTLYYLLTSKPPFPEGNATEKLLQHRLEKTAPVEEVRRSELIARGADPKELKYLSSKVGKLVRKLMQKEPAKRLQTPAELVVALTAILDVSPSVIAIKDRRIAALVKGKEKKVVAQKTNALAEGDPNLPKFTQTSEGSQESDDKLVVVPAVMGARQRKVRKTFRVITIFALLLFFLGVGLVLGLALHRRVRHQAAVSSPHPTEAQKEWEALEPKLSQLGDTDEIWKNLLDFKLRFPDSPEAKEVSNWYQKLRSPLDHLNRSQLAKKERFNWQPSEHVAILRNKRHWEQNIKDPCESVAFGPSARHVAASWAKTGVVLWQSATLPRSGSPVANYRADVHHLVFSPDGKRLALGGADGDIALCDAATGKIDILQKSGRSVAMALGFSAASGNLLSLDKDGEVLEWKSAKSQPVQLFPPSNQTEVVAGAISHDGTVIVKGCKDSRLVILPCGKTTLTGHEHRLSAAWQPVSLAFSPDDRLLAAVCRDGNAKIFITFYRREGDRFHFMEQIAAKDPKIQSIAVSPDNQRFVTGSMSSHLAVWNIERTQPEHDLELRWPIRAVAIAADGRHIAAALQEGTVYILRLSPPAAVQNAWR